jgi:hypothetical protein
MTTTRTARCACGRVEVTVDGEPGHTYTCHCDFCQRRSGSVVMASATFSEDQVVSIVGETHCYNGLEIDGVESFLPGGINYRFCAVCGSSIYFDLIYPETGGRFYTIALGCFVEPLFPTPDTEFATKFRHPWMAEVSGALQIPDPTGADAEAAWKASDPRGPQGSDGDPA